MLARAFPGRLALIAGLVLLAGALPAIFAVLVAAIVDALPSAIAGGLGSPDGRRIVGALAAIGLVLVLQEVAGAAREIAETDLYRRYDEYLLARVMTSALSVPGLELFEVPELAAKTDRAVRIVRFGPGELVSGLAEKGSVQAHQSEVRGRGRCVKSEFRRLQRQPGASKARAQATDADRRSAPRPFVHRRVLSAIA